MSTSKDECQMSNDEGMIKSESRNASVDLRRWGIRSSFVINHSCFVVSSRFRSLAYHVGRLFVKLLFACVARIRVLQRENGSRVGGFLLAANHISHFDPFLLSLAVRRKIDWMTMAEFFRPSMLGFLLRAIDAFPAERDRADLKTIRTAIERVKSGRVVGLFPEGGIRDGTRSLLEGAPLRPGASTLAQIAAAPVLPCVILGSDRLYSKKQWLPFRRTPIWIAVGNPISHFSELPKSQARERIESELAAAFKDLYAELREQFRLTPDDLPQPPLERMNRRRASAALAAHPNGNRSGCSAISNARLQRLASGTIDSVICGSLNLLHTRHRLNGRSREDMVCYVAECERLTPQEYYAAPYEPDLAKTLINGHARIAWNSPIRTRFATNNIARAEFFRCAQGIRAPTVLLLHALMSTGPAGHRRWAEHFNELGWNACLLHLPYHFSRVPRGYWNGELAITCDLIRNAEGLRQGVMELRQLMSGLRERGCREFGVLATSYGGWIGALLALVESDFRFVALMSPIVNVEHAIWQSPAARRIRHELRQANIEPSLVARHFHLSSPLHTQPLCDPASVLFVTGEFDSIAPTSQIEAIQQKWRGSELLRVRQGHFGHRMMRETISRLKQRGDLQTRSGGF